MGSGEKCKERICNGGIVWQWDCEVLCGCQVLYGGHDVTVMPLLMMLTADQNQAIPCSRFCSLSLCFSHFSSSTVFAFVSLVSLLSFRLSPRFFAGAQRPLDLCMN